jgi:hypothetical protein
MSWLPIAGRSQHVCGNGSCHNFLSQTQRAYCSISCSTSHTRPWATPRGNQRSLESVLVEHSTYSTGNVKRRLLREGIKQPKCDRCGLTEWNGEPAPLEMDQR